MTLHLKDDKKGMIGKLEIISITPDHGGNAQLIFKSLNSTRLALEEGDKIRNYILMGLNPRKRNVCCFWGISEVLASIVSKIMIWHGANT